MSSLKEKILRTPRTWTDVAPLTLFLGFVLFYLGAILASFTGFLNVVKLFTADPDAQDLMADYAIFTGIWVVFIPLFIIFQCKKDACYNNGYLTDQKDIKSDTVSSLDLRKIRPRQD